jgi:hypothetical protein
MTSPAEISAGLFLAFVVIARSQRVARMRAPDERRDDRLRDEAIQRTAK